MIVMSKPFFPTTKGLTITSPYGWRWHPIHEEYRFHSGIDIGGGGVNHPIYATQSGIVTNNFYTEWGGWIVELSHTGDTYHSRYLHLAVKSPIAIGTRVAKGQRIGTMGSTGDSTGIHLHFEISPTGRGWSTESGTIDPMYYLDMEFEGGDLDPGDPGDPGDPDKKGTKDIIHLLLCDALNGWKY